MLCLAPEHQFTLTIHRAPGPLIKGLTEQLTEAHVRFVKLYRRHGCVQCACIQDVAVAYVGRQIADAALVYNKFTHQNKTQLAGAESMNEVNYQSHDVMWANMNYSLQIYT